MEFPFRFIRGGEFFVLHELCIVVAVLPWPGTRLDQKVIMDSRCAHQMDTAETDLRFLFCSDWDLQ